MAGHLGAGVVSRGEFGGYLRCETFEGGLVVAVGAAGGVAACHGMLGYGSHGGNYREPGFPGHVLQLGKGVVVGTVAIYAHYHGSCAVAIELCYPFGGRAGHSSGVCRGGDDSHFVA